MSRTVKWALVALLVIWLFSVGQGNPLDGAITLLQEITRGKRLTHAPAGDDGVARYDPAALADSCGATLDEYAGARMIASEEPRADSVTKAAIAWCLVNEAARRGTSIAAVLLHAKDPDHDGYFGSQKDKDPASPNRGNSDRYATTALDPYQGELDIMRDVLTGRVPDFTGGAQQYDRPAGEADPDRVATNRMNAGAQLVEVPGVDPGLRFWRT